MQWTSEHADTSCQLTVAVRASGVQPELRVPAVGSVLSPARAMDFALEVAIAILVIGGHMIAAISLRIRYGAAMKCEVCNVFLNGPEQFDRHLRGGTHYKGLKKRKRQAERDVQSYEILMNDMLRKKAARRCEDQDLPCITQPFCQPSSTLSRGELPFFVSE